MVAADDGTGISRPVYDAERTREALGRGELVRLLADVESGRMAPEQLEAAIEERNKRHWLRLLILALFGR